MDILQNYVSPVNFLSQKPSWQRWAVYYFFIVAIVTLGNFNNSKFIYFQF